MTPVHSDASSDPSKNLPSQEGVAAMPVLSTVIQNPAANGFITDTMRPTLAWRQREAAEQKRRPEQPYA
jgi:hypothetical protein